MAIDFKIQGDLSTNRAATNASSDKKKKTTELNEGSSLPEGNHQKNHRADVQEAVERVSGYVQNVRRDLQFSVDDQSGETVIKVIDSETNEVVRQIPPEEMIRLASDLDRNYGKKGVLFKDEV